MLKLSVLMPMLLFCFSGCEKEINDASCNLIPDPGPCKGAFIKYYFDQSEKKCKTFVYGGCDGLVPFETMEDCTKKCPR